MVIKIIKGAFINLHNLLKKGFFIYIYETNCFYCLKIASEIHNKFLYEFKNLKEKGLEELFTDAEDFARDISDNFKDSKGLAL